VRASPATTVGDDLADADPQTSAYDERRDQDPIAKGELRFGDRTRLRRINA
jgi:hypothetical protein